MCRFALLTVGLLGTVTCYDTAQHKSCEYKASTRVDWEDCAKHFAREELLSRLKKAKQAGAGDKQLGDVIKEYKEQIADAYRRVKEADKACYILLGKGPLTAEEVRDFNEYKVRLVGEYRSLFEDYKSVMGDTEPLDDPLLCFLGC
jgi:hypothetical protein